MLKLCKVAKYGEDCRLSKKIIIIIGTTMDETRFHDLSQFSLTTSETELDYHHQRVNVGVASKLAERLNTKILEN